MNPKSTSVDSARIANPQKIFTRKHFGVNCGFYEGAKKHGLAVTCGL